MPGAYRNETFRQEFIRAALTEVRLAGQSGLTQREVKGRACKRLGATKYVPSPVVWLMLSGLVDAGLLRRALPSGDGRFPRFRACPPVDGDEGALLDAIADEVGRDLAVQKPRQGG